MTCVMVRFSNSAMAYLQGTVNCIPIYEKLIYIFLVSKWRDKIKKSFIILLEKRFLAIFNTVARNIIFILICLCVLVSTSFCLFHTYMTCITIASSLWTKSHWKNVLLEIVNSNKYILSGVNDFFCYYKYEWNCRIGVTEIEWEQVVLINRLC